MPTHEEVITELLAERDALYADRNRAVQLAAKLAEERGYAVGLRVDPNEPDWPVLMIDLPTGQISYHLASGEAYPVWDLYEGEWDGHTNEEKADRIYRFVVPPLPRYPWDYPPSESESNP